MNSSSVSRPRKLSLGRNSDVSRSRSSELRMVFNYFDENGDGRISAEELRSCVGTMGGQLTEAEAEAAVQWSDTDGDGQLGFEEFVKLVEGCGGEEERKKDLREAFGMYTTEDGSGCITPGSLKRMLSRLGEKRSIEDCKAMIRAFDINGDGVLCFDEFRVMMR